MNILPISRNRILCGLLLLAAASCAKETVLPLGEDTVSVVFSADLSEITKTNLASDMTVKWSESDKVAIYDGVTIRKFTVVSGAGTPNATLSGRVSASASSFTAVYPYEAAKLEGTKLLYNIPSSQTIASGAIADPAALVTTASAAKGEVLAFRNATSLLRIGVTSGVSKLYVQLGNVTTSVDLPSAVGNYYVAVEPGDYEDGIRVFAVKGSEVYIRESASMLTAVRSRVVSLGDFPLLIPAYVIRNASDLQSFLGQSSSTFREEVFLLEDIDVNGKDWTSAKGFAGTFYGLGHSINGITCGQPLFAASTGSFSDLTLEGSVQPVVNEYAPLVAENRGAISNVTSRVNILFAAEESLSSSVVIGGIAAYSYSPLEDCVNEGSITFSSSVHTPAVAIGGIAGYLASSAAFCINRGELVIEGVCENEASAISSISNAVHALGGIAAYGASGFSLADCRNEGALRYDVNSIENIEANIERIGIGGIAGSPAGDIVRCVNDGAITVSAVTSDRSGFSEYAYLLCVGGIAGSEYFSSDRNTSNITGCTNNGNINFDVDSYRSYNTCAGIFGWPNLEAVDINNCTTNCVNNGDIMAYGSSKTRFGGIQGGTGAIESCTNTGNLTVISANELSDLGGICAFHSRNNLLHNCSNTGDVRSDVFIEGVGGLIGRFGNSASSVGTGCSVSCTVTHADGSQLATGIVLGAYNATGNAVTIGSTVYPVEVEGYVSLAGRTIELNSANYSSYLSGSTNTATNRVIYAHCGGEAPVTGYYAEGYVKYTDGAAAVGVTVSDGFRTCITDDKGYYRLTTSTDTWYIYVSYPSDAVIEKQSSGQPNFFVKYNYPTSRYDFTFKRQAVEDEFLIFAMADPQAHYAKRGTQTKADTDRFKAETVPALNNHIAAQSLPCYGITLGDIVYSEGTRNSNSGMSTMRSHFASVNMPVFQTMGNHDYTYFGSSSPLSTDGTSSSLYLKAQRKFEAAFGPINLSFNRGDVHFVCMRDINYDSTTDASDYHGGFNADQFEWLKADLANVPKDKMIVLCVHIPICGILTKENVSATLNLMKQYKNATVFSGHTHYKRSYDNLNSTGIFEHIHSAVCGQWWWSNIEGDGNPNGYTVYRFKGTEIEDEYFMGVNNKMNTRSYQMRIYKGNIKNGGSYAYFKWPFEANRILINVFNGDSHWTVKVYENGVYKGNATLMSNYKQSYNSVTSGKTYTVSTSSNQDWWAIGYHIGVVGRGTSGTGYYTNMFHMFTYTLSSASSSVKVEAIDPYGNTYTCTDVISSDCYYPSYIPAGGS